MFIDLSSHFILILFKTMIFILLLIQIYSLNKKYVLPFLRKQIAQIHTTLKNLTNQQTLLQSTRTRIQEQIDKQHITLVTLEEKMQCWYTARQEKRVREATEFAQQCEKFREKQKKQRAYASTVKMQQELIPEAFASAEEILREQYAKESEHITTILDELAHHT